MPVETAGDLAVMLDSDEFGVAATYTLAVGGDTPITGIFDMPAEIVERNAGPGIISAELTFQCASAALPAGAVAGDTIEINSVNYTVRTVLPDGTGLTEIELEKA